jgi:hypothetical protein
MTVHTVAALAARITGARLERARTIGGHLWVRPKNGGARFVMVPSQSQPGLRHRVDGRGCTCRGYAHRGRCVHHDSVMLLIAEMAQKRAAA